MMGDAIHIRAQTDNSSCLFNVQECLRTIVGLAGPLSASIMLQASRRFAMDSDCISIAQNGELVVGCVVHTNLNTSEADTFYPPEIFEVYCRRWRPLPSLPFPCNGSLLAVFGNCMYSFGGLDPGNHTITSVVSKCNLIENESNLIEKKVIALRAMNLLKTTIAV